MSSTYTFNSTIRLGSALPSFTDEQVKNEPMLFNCNADTAYRLGGPITRAFLEGLGSFQRVVIDTRSHMLMPGWWPCIPGWHHDDIPRTRRDGQPNYDTPEYRSVHAMALVNGGICPTEFAIGRCAMPKLPLGTVIYKHWHPLVEALCVNGDLERVSAPSNQIVWFDWQTFHQGIPAVSAGWRWFGRASFETDRKPTNEVRRQVQVYLQFPMEGW
jgi:hypothetical protein